MITSDPPEAGGLHAGPPATEVARSAAYRSSAGWSGLRLALTVGGIAVGALLAAGLARQFLTNVKSSRFRN